MDKNRICQIKVATIKKIVGKRLHIAYYNTDPEEDGKIFAFKLTTFLTILR